MRGSHDFLLGDLFRHYAKFLDGVREQANRLNEKSMEEWDRASRGQAPER
ncbi:integrase [Streptomyces sp. NPDC056944]